MPTSPLIDLASIDLSQRLMDRRAIAEYLPHRGPIAMLDALIWQDDPPNAAVAVCHIPHDVWWRDGHIPGTPLMPGVLMIEAAAQLASLIYYMRSEKDWFAGFTRVNDVAFRGQVRPGDDLHLICVGRKFNPKRFVTAIQGVVGGQIVFDGEISGMAFPQLGEHIERRPLTDEELAHSQHHA
jgi:3-hydroxyacyl-[acyl-carrier-protein] dehydratase